MNPGALLITGGGKRVGKELALFLGASGYEIAIHYRASKAAAEAVAKTITQGGGQAITLQANLDNTLETQNLIDRAAEKLGRPVTGLINNAAAFQQDTLESFNQTSFEKNINTNLRAPMLLCQAFARALPKKTPGAIVNIIDQRVLNLTPGFLTYTLSKHALLTLTRILAVELGPQIRVNGIGPGPTLPSVYQSEEDFANEVAGLPLGQGPTLNEIARAAKFLLETPAMTGQMIALDGGQHLL